MEPEQLSEREMRIIQYRYGLAGEGPFTLEESRILNILAKTFTKEELKYISEETIVSGHEFLNKRWEDLMKLLGHSFKKSTSRKIFFIGAASYRHDS